MRSKLLQRLGLFVPRDELGAQLPFRWLSFA